MDSQPNPSVESIIPKPFPFVTNLVIPTSEYLNSVNALTKLLDNLGAHLKPVLHDMRNNILVLLKLYESRPENFETLQNVIEYSHQSDQTCFESLVWLNRELNYVSAFFEVFLNSPEEGENLRNCILTAYERTLGNYQTFVFSALLMMACKFSPTRMELTKTLTENFSLELEAVNIQLNIYTGSIRKVVKATLNLIENAEGARTSHPNS